jgi:hypothetical protein
MNWAPEIVMAEMNYRVERAVGDVRDNELIARLHATERHLSWWRRLRAEHRHNGARSAA